MRHVKVEVWAVYHSPMKGCPEGVRAVCSQEEWEAMDLAKPGFRTLVRGHIMSEGEAERLARGRSGEKPSLAEKEKARFAASEAAAALKSPLPV
jgi:hypothetical protein